MTFYNKLFKLNKIQGIPYAPTLIGRSKYLTKSMPKYSKKNLNLSMKQHSRIRDNFTSRQ